MNIRELIKQIKSWGYEQELVNLNLQQMLEQSNRNLELNLKLLEKNEKILDSIEIINKKMER